MADLNTIDKATEHYTPQNSDPIDWQKDSDSVLISKINARIADAKPLHTKKCQEWKEADSYLDGDPSKVDKTKQKLIYNPLFPIIRNMTGLVTDSKPNPSVRLVSLDEGLSEEQKEEMRRTASNLSISLEEWWDDIRGQSKLQQWIMAMWTYADYFVMPFWNNKTKEVDLEPLKPNRVHISPNANEIEEADYAVVDFYRSKQWMTGKYGADRCKELNFADYSEMRLDDDQTGTDENGHLLKNVCKLQLYMEAEKWVYKVGDVIMEKISNPFWALDEAGQKAEIETSVANKYKKTGFKGVVDKVTDAAKGVMGMETMDDKIKEEVSAAMISFVPKKNYLPYPRIPIVQFDTFRMGGELYSRSTVKQSIPGIDNINARKHDIQENSENMGKPTTYVDGKIMNEEQAKRVQTGKARGETIRLNTGENRTLSASVFVAQGTPVPGQFFEDIEVNKREIDNIFGHHEVSRGGSDASNKTKGGILALQDADQTPIRYVTRNIEDALQDIFAFVIQIRKIFKPGKYSLENGGSVDYDIIDQHFKVFMKSGSMMPVSKEAQRNEAMELWSKNALDPLTLYERLNDPEPEKTAKRLEAWIKEKSVLTDGMDDQQQRVLEKIRAIQANAFDQVKPSAEDDPKVHHDMLLMALKSGRFSHEQEQFLAQLIEQYNQMVQQNGQPGQGGPATPPAPATPPEMPVPPPQQ